jgi:hypothetical protein
MNDGATILVHAPAEIEIETASQVFLHRGRLSSYVPENALGFTVRTPGATIVDYGTEFGVMVNEKGITEAHVFTGRVDLRTGSNPRVFERAQRLIAGQAGVVDLEGNLNAKSARTAGFVRGMKALRQSESLLGKNLVVNGDFEADEGVVFDVSESNVPDINITGWNDSSKASVLSYHGNVLHGYPDILRDTIPSRCGRNFFVGVGNCSISQEIDVSLFSYLIDTARLKYSFSAWLGGFAEHPDSAELTVVFLNEKNHRLGSAKLNQVTVSERRGKTGFVERDIKGIVPVGTARIRIELESFQRIGLADSYADNIQIKLLTK